MKKLYHSELGVPVFLKPNRPSQQFPRAYTQGSFWEEMYIVSLKVIIAPNSSARLWVIQPYWLTMF